MGLFRPHLSPELERDEQLGRCERCGSLLVQPQGWKELGGDKILIYLRCPECFTFRTPSVGHDVLARYDEELISGRNAILAQYEALVYRNMSELAERFARALELDLIGADDFGSGVGARHAA
jgi:hypothetical protein